jgi:hypothetical protein
MLNEKYSHPLALGFIVLVASLILQLLSPPIALQAQQQGPPIEKKGLLMALSRKALTKDELIRFVTSRGVSFHLTTSDEQEIRKAGAYLGAKGLNDLIAAIRDNYRPKVMDAVKDFRPANPNGVWSYGWTESRLPSQEFILFSENISIFEGLRYKWFVSRGGQQHPSITYVKSDSSGAPVDYENAVHPPTLLNLYPGPNGERSVVRWTAPSDGTYHIEGRFEGINRPKFDRPMKPGTTTDVAVLYKQGFALKDTQISNYRSRAPISYDVTVKANETIDFSVGYGSDGNNESDATGLSIVITRR